MGLAQSNNFIPTATIDGNNSNLKSNLIKEETEPLTQSEFFFPTPTGKEYEVIDNIMKELPAIIDDESRQQVEDYIQACDHGRGPIVSCFSTAEYISLFLRKHKEAETLYRNTCFRPNNDKSSNGIKVDGSVAYPAACFNLGQMRMTGKGGTKFDRGEGYKLFERACKTGHGGACYMQAKMLSSYPGSLGDGIPYDPKKSKKLLENVCNNGDSMSCFTLASMLLRGNFVNNEADNVSPEEARGLAPIKIRTNEKSRLKRPEDPRISLARDPTEAKRILKKSCNEQQHAPSCYNLAVMYAQGDEGIEKNLKKAEKYKKKTEKLVEKFGGL